MKKSIIILLCMFFCCVKGFAQTDAQFTLFPWASLYYNPGAAGEQNNTLCFTAFFKQQYIGFKTPYYEEGAKEPKYDNDSPQQILFNAEFASRKIRGAFGLSIINDKPAGLQNNVGIRLGYAYKQPLGNGNLGIGLQVGLLNMAFKTDNFRPKDPNDPTLTNVGNAKSYMSLDFNFGLFYKTEQWYVGASATNLAATKTLTISGGDEARTVRQLYVHGGYIWTIPSNPSWTLEPQALVKTDLSTAQLDLMVLARYNGVIWTGLSYRIDNAVSVLVGARPFNNSSNNYLKGLEIGVSYGFTTAKFGYKTEGSYGDAEVMVRYGFDIFKKEVFSGYGSTRSIYKNQY